MIKQTGQELKEIQVIPASFTTIVCSVLWAILCVESKVRPRNISVRVEKLINSVKTLNSPDIFSSISV